MRITNKRSSWWRREPELLGGWMHHNRIMRQRNGSI